MVQFTLPKNSTIRTGKTWPKPEGAKNVRKFSIYRWSPDDGQNPRVDTYFIDMDKCGPGVLGARGREGLLSFILSLAVLL